MREREHEYQEFEHHQDVLDLAPTSDVSNFCT